LAFDKADFVIGMLSASTLQFVLPDEFMQTPIAQDLLDGIRRWVEIESFTADVDGVNRLITHVAEGYAKAGGRIERIAGRNGRGDHLAISSPWGGDKPGILLLAHLDTVHPPGTINTLPFRVEGDRAFGPGIFDMKGGAYLAFAAFRSIAGAGRTTPLPLRFLYTSDEEVGSQTSRELIERAADSAKYVLVVEPARDGKLITARKGIGDYLLEAEGRAAHAGSRHEEGRSAILEVAKQVLAIEALTDYERGVTFNVGKIQGGTATNTVPQFCQAEIDMRINSLADAEEIERRLFSLRSHNPDVTIKVTGQLNRPPFEKNAGIAMLFDRARELAKEIGFELADCSTGSVSDGNFTAPKVPTLDGLGVDGAGGHTLQEHLFVSSLVPRMTLLRRLFETLT
jgi:glutamate carboxypeptidase